MEKWTVVELDNFNGPLDLLLHLIKEKNLDIFDINLNEISAQYLAYIQCYEALNVEIASEYLTMAVYLVELKSKMLLPRQEVEIEDNYENALDDLANRLIEYHKIKEAVTYFKERQSEYLDVFSKERSVIKAPKVNEDELPLAPNGIDLDKFAKIFLKVIEKNKFKHPDTNVISIKEISPEEISKEIVQFLQEHKTRKRTWTLEELLAAKGVTLQMMLALFLAILDLAKNQIIHIEQEQEEIFIHMLGE